MLGNMQLIEQVLDAARQLPDCIQQRRIIAEAKVLKAKLRKLDENN